MSSIVVVLQQKVTNYHEGKIKFNRLDSIFGSVILAKNIHQSESCDIVVDSLLVVLTEGA